MTDHDKEIKKLEVALSAAAEFIEAGVRLKQYHCDRRRDLTPSDYQKKQDHFDTDTIELEKAIAALTDNVST